MLLNNFHFALLNYFPNFYNIWLSKLVLYVTKKMIKAFVHEEKKTFVKMIIKPKNLFKILELRHIIHFSILNFVCMMFECQHGQTNLCSKQVGEPVKHYIPHANANHFGTKSLRYYGH